MKKLIRNIVVGTLVVQLSGCAALGALGSVASGIFGSTTGDSSTHVNTTLDTQVGDRGGLGGGDISKLGIGGDVKGGEVTGKDKYQAQTITINQNSWRDMLIIFALMIVVVAVVFLHVPQPKWLVNRKIRKLLAQSCQTESSDQTQVLVDSVDAPASDQKSDQQ